MGREMPQSNGVQHVDETGAGGAGLARPIAMPRLSRRMRWRLLIGAALVVVLAGIGAFWGFRRGTPVHHYLTAPVTRGSVERAVSTSGTVNPVLTIIVGSYVSGVIVHQYCDYNTQVKKGQLCAQIDPRPYQTTVDQARAELGTAQAQLNKDRASLTYQKITYERDVGLLQRGIVSQDTVDSAKSAYEQAQAQVELDQAMVRQREAALKAARINLEYTDIRSPVSGTVVSRNITIGQTVAASFQTPTLFLIATDLTQMEVDTNVSETDIGRVREGNPAVFTVETFPGRPFEGKVTQVRQAPQTVQNVVTYDVVIAVDNKALLLKPGMTATTRIVVAHRDDVLRVPDQALRFLPGRLTGAPPASLPPTKPATAASEPAVWILRDGQAQRVPLKLGLDDDAYSEVVAGEIAQGDEVLIGEQRSDAAQPALWPRLFGR